MKTITYNFTAEYASQTELTRIPYGHVNKTVCGTGVTSLAIENKFHTVIAVPGVELVNNKEIQYPNKRCSYKVLGVKGGIRREDIDAYIRNCTELKQPVKIIVTYDSLSKLEDLILNNKIDLVIDECDQLLSLTDLKVNSKDNLNDIDAISYLYDLAKQVRERVSFVSATTIPLQYLPKWISELDQVTMHWENSMKSTAFLRKHSYPTKVLKSEIINPILEKGYFEMSDNNGNFIKSSKAIIFLNSVTDIMKVITECSLAKEDVKLIIGDSVKNDATIRGYDRLKSPNELAKFTFVTSTGFQGIDLEDLEATAVVVSNTKKSYTMIDIATSLQQAISRQRNKDNINYGKYIFIYNQSLLESSEKDIKEAVEEVREQVAFDCLQYKKFETEREKDSFRRNYGSNYEFVKYSIYNKALDEYQVNDNILNARLYNLLEVKKQFEKGFDIQGKIGNTIIPSKITVSKAEVSFKQLVDIFNESEDKASIDWEGYENYKNWIKIIQDCYYMTGKVYSSPEFCKKHIELSQNPLETLRYEVTKRFNVGKKYDRAEIKEILQKIYDNNNIKRKAKHSDLIEFFEVKEGASNGVRNMEILKRK